MWLKQLVSFLVLKMCIYSYVNFVRKAMSINGAIMDYLTPKYTKPSKPNKPAKPNTADGDAMLVLSRATTPVSSV